MVETAAYIPAGGVMAGRGCSVVSAYTFNLSGLMAARRVLYGTAGVPKPLSTGNAPCAGSVGGVMAGGVMAGSIWSI
jgi:hypothetical protein